LSGLLVLGAGGHGKVVADAALASGWQRIAFLDDRIDARTARLGLEILGATSDLGRHRTTFSAAAVAIGDARRRLELLDACREMGYELPSIVHPSAVVSRFATLEPGCVAFAQCAVNADAVLGAGCIVNTGATIDHDCVLGRGVHVCPGAHLAGSVQVGERAWIGIGAVIRQGIAIGRDAIVGAGAVVVADVSETAMVMGAPAKPREDVKT
jgi:sugar O-acyltransferase (sialic acid O-acetyltransferase NeuD family)